MIKLALQASSLATSSIIIAESLIDYYRVRTPIYRHGALVVKGSPSKGQILQLIHFAKQGVKVRLK